MMQAMVGTRVMLRPLLASASRGHVQCRQTIRAFSATATSSSSSNGSVKLAFEAYEAPKGKLPAADAGAVVLCHGLFGSKQNWRSLAKAIAQRLALPVYAVDLRNHGTSPHTSSMRYDEMADDLIRFFDDHSIRNAILTGHSMGGKAVQSMALRPDLPSDYINYLVSVDMSPARGPLSQEFAQYVEAMIRVQEAKCWSRQDADAILKQVEPDLGVRQFLLTNLTRAPGEEQWTFRIPITTIRDVLYQIGDFPYNDEKGLMLQSQFKPDEERPTARWDGKTLFVKGAKSKYINRRNIPVCDALFPNAQHVTLDTGHWVQAEKPNEFVDALAKFVTES